MMIGNGISLWMPAIRGFYLGANINPQPNFLGSSNPYGGLGVAGDFNPWNTQNVTVTTGLAGAPDGSSTAASEIETNDTGTPSEHILTETLGNNFGPGTSPIIPLKQYRVACRIKAFGRNRVSVHINGGDTNVMHVGFDLVGLQQAFFVAPPANTSQFVRSKITNIGSGWRLIEIFFITEPTSTFLGVNYILDAGAGLAAQNVIYVGDGVSGLLLWGSEVNLCS